MDNDETTPWKYSPNGSGGTDANEPAPLTPDRDSSGKDEALISWTASEYIDHANGLGWYGTLLLATLVSAAGVYFLTKDYLATGTIVLVGGIVAAAAARRPQQTTYELSDVGLKIGDKSYSYKSFKSFYIAQEGGLRSIGLMPLKKFMPSLSVYFDPTEEKKITDMLGQHLPYEEHKLDAVDRLSRRLRF